jgi:hypothetical protein|tara:strand:+ start:3220 stop:4710 length:1491 start_codon:yes stop_codon:yes gene_type:complete
MTYILPNNLLTESGIRNIRELAKRYKKAKIYFHQDLDGVTTALGMKYYLENNGIDVVDAEIIQYGDMEFAVKKADATGEVMPVLVDFAHGKPMFIIHTDHHDTQVGVEKGASTQFRSSRSNVETISQVVSPTDIFPSSDIKMINAVDSADFVANNVTPDDIMRYIFKMDKEQDFNQNKKVQALVTNKLLLAYKNKPQFLEKLVMQSTPSLINIYQNIVRIAKEEGYATPEEMTGNQKNYIAKQKESDKVKFDEEYGIITQYGGGSMIKPGSYDRYTPFKNNPDANFIVLVWPLGLMQSSCNPFQANRSLKGVNLGDIAQEVLLKFKDELQNFTLTFDTIKYFAEKHKSFDTTPNEKGQFGKHGTPAPGTSVGFTNTDMMALFGETEGGIRGLDTTPKGASTEYTVERWQAAIKKIMDKPYKSLNDKEIKALKLISISGWDMVQANSGGHKCITNISGFMYFGKEGVPFMKKIAREFYGELKRKIDVDKDVKLKSED